MAGAIAGVAGAAAAVGKKPAKTGGTGAVAGCTGFTFWKRLRRYVLNGEFMSGLMFGFRSGLMAGLNRHAVKNPHGAASVCNEKKIFVRFMKRCWCRFTVTEFKSYQVPVAFTMLD